MLTLDFTSASEEGIGWGYTESKEPIRHTCRDLYTEGGAFVFLYFQPEVEKN